MKDPEAGFGSLTRRTGLYPFERSSEEDVAKTSGAYMKSEGPNTFKGLDMTDC